MASKDGNREERWADFYQLIIDGLDVYSCAEEWGTKFSGGEGGNGWRSCYSRSRDEDNPSAAINGVTGYYKDHAGQDWPFFQFAARFGPYSSFSDAVEELAKRAGVWGKRPKSKDGESFYSKVRYREWNDIHVILLAKKYGIDPSIIKLAGGSLGTCVDQMTVTFPVLNPGRFSGKLNGNCSISAAGLKLSKYRGKEKEPLLVPHISRGRGGMINQHAADNWDSAKVIFKTEGISDMLRLQHEIPEAERSKYVAITNSDGCDARSTASAFAGMVRDKIVVVIHDHDKPGQTGNSQGNDGGAKFWCNQLSTEAKMVYNVCLWPHLKIADKKGKDLRDWFDEGYTFEDLKRLVRKTLPIKKGTIAPTLTRKPKEHEELLRKLGLIVLGYTPKNHAVAIFNQFGSVVQTVKDISRLTYNDMELLFGPKAWELIASPADLEKPEGMYSTSEVTSAISRAASGRIIDRNNTFGLGIWESSGRAIAVGCGEWIAVNGGVDVFHHPTSAGKIVEFGSESEAWYNQERLLKYLEPAKDPEWRQNVFDDLLDVLKLWGNHEHPQGEECLLSLMIGGFMQSVLPWRPWVAITGESDTGKSALFEFMKRLFGPLSAYTDDTSLAGMKAAIGRSSKIFMHDEFEKSQHRDSILQALMSTNSREGGSSFRSNAAQESLSSSFQLMPFFGSTEVKMDKQTERNRYVIFSLRQRDGWFNLPEADSQWWSDMRDKCIAICLRIWQRMQEIFADLMVTMQQEHGRQGRSYATIGALYGAIQGLSNEAAKEWVTKIANDALLYDSGGSGEIEKEHDLVFESILSSSIFLGGGKTKTVSQLINAAGADTARDHGVTSADILETYGMKLIAPSHVHRIGRDIPIDHYLFVCTGKTHAVRRKLLRDTEFSKLNIKQLLMRVEGAVSRKLRVGGTPLSGVLVPINVAKTDPFGAEVEENDDLAGV